LAVDAQGDRLVAVVQRKGQLRVDALDPPVLFRIRVSREDDVSACPDPKAVFTRHRSRAGREIRQHEAVQIDGRVEANLHPFTFAVSDGRRVRHPLGNRGIAATRTDVARRAFVEAHAGAQDWGTARVCVTRRSEVPLEVFVLRQRQADLIVRVDLPGDSLDRAVVVHAVEHDTIDSGDDGSWPRIAQAESQLRVDAGSRRRARPEDDPCPRADRKTLFLVDDRLQRVGRRPKLKPIEVGLCVEPGLEPLEVSVRSFRIGHPFGDPHSTRPGCADRAARPPFEA